MPSQELELWNRMMIHSHDFFKCQPNHQAQRLCGMKSEKVYIEYLLLKLQAGDSQAADDLLVLVIAKVKAFSIKLLKDKALVDDCVQDTLVKIAAHIQQVKTVAAVHTWIYRVTHSCAMDLLRKQAKLVINESFENNDSSVDVGPSTTDELDVQKAISQLSSMHQGLIYLFYYEGFTLAEIASIFDKPTGTIKYELFQARKAIKSFLT